MDAQLRSLGWGCSALTQPQPQTLSQDWWLTKPADAPAVRDASWASFVKSGRGVEWGRFTAPRNLNEATPAAFGHWPPQNSANANANAHASQNLQPNLRWIDEVPLATKSVPSGFERGVAQAQARQAQARQAQATQA